MNQWKAMRSWTQSILLRRLENKDMQNCLLIPSSLRDWLDGWTPREKRVLPLEQRPCKISKGHHQLLQLSLLTSILATVCVWDGGGDRHGVIKIYIPKFKRTICRCYPSSHVASTHSLYVHIESAYMVFENMPQYKPS